MDHGRAAWGSTMATSYRYSGDDWRKRAEEMRSIAEQLNLFERAKATMLRIAEEYERLGTRAEERLGAGSAI